MARVSLPEDVAVVEAMVEHIYTGVLPNTVDPLDVLPLAHRFGLRECVAACALAADHCDTAHAVQAFLPLLEVPAVAAAWARIKRRIHHNDELLESVLLKLAEGARHRPTRAPQLVDACVQTEPEADAGGSDDDDAGGGGSGGGQPGDRGGGDDDTSGD